MKLYGYTTVFRYVYENESIENFYYFVRMNICHLTKKLMR